MTTTVEMQDLPRQQLAFALGGGGARGALQVGALRALLEAGLRPDLLVGTSIGAVNAVFLAMHGYSLQALDALKDAWLAAAAADLFPANMAWLTLRVFFNRVRAFPYQRIKEFYIAQGVLPDLRFGDLSHLPVVLVSADLSSRQPVYYGIDARQSVLEGLLASTALPPWISPIEVDGRFLVDGGIVSNLPIEPAIAHGASQVIALALRNPASAVENTHGFSSIWMKVLDAVETRQTTLELALAQTKGVPVQVFNLTTASSIPAWDFSQTHFLLQDGYSQMKSALNSHKAMNASSAQCAS